MFKNPNLVIFDLDNTLYDYKVADTAGKNALHGYLADVTNQSAASVAEQLLDARNSLKKRLGNVSSSHSRLLYVREFLWINKFRFHSSFALECEQIYWREYFNNTFLFPGVVELLTSLRLRKTMTVLVTDLNTHIQLRKLALLGLDKAFDLVVTSEEAGGDKKTGLPEEFLESILSPFPKDIWCVGDMEWDHLFSKKSLFMKRVANGPFRSHKSGQFEFANFFDLAKQLED
jgi:FMN phosphatase YigB (HAD superfamily)